MIFDTLLRSWKRPRTSSELESWRVLELQMNAQLLGDGEGPIPHWWTNSSKPSTKGRPKWGSPASSMSRHSSEKPSQDEQNNWSGTNYDYGLPHSAYETYTIAFVSFLAYTLVLTLYGAVVSAYELYRMFDIVGHKMRRPLYYEAEAKKRAERFRQQRSNAHRIRHRSSWLVPPAPCELMEAWNAAHRRGAVQEKVRLGTMLSVIEAAVDNGLIRNLDGEIVGRKAGIKGWLAKECPDLLPQYSTLMRYKAVADKLAKVCGLSDPYPEEILITDNKGKDDNAIMVGTTGCPGLNRRDKRPLEGIAITVGTNVAVAPEGMASSKGTTPSSLGTITSQGILTLRGVKPEVSQDIVESRRYQLSECRRKAQTITKEVQRADARRSLRTLDDFLYSRLGLVRERRCIPNKR